MAKGMSVVLFLILCILLLLLLLLTVLLLLLLLKRAFKWASRRVNLTIQPTTVLHRFTVGRFLTLIMGAIDRERRGDHNALGLRFVRWMEEKIYPIYCFWFATRGVHCGTSYHNILQYCYWIDYY